LQATAQQLAGIAGTAERDGTLMNARLSAAKRHIQDLEAHVKLLVYPFSLNKLTFLYLHTDKHTLL
jgi:hypothetical protein